MTPSHYSLHHDYRQKSVARGRKKLVDAIDLCPFEQLQLNSGRHVIVIGCQEVLVATNGEWKTQCRPEEYMNVNRS